MTPRGKTARVTQLQLPPRPRERHADDRLAFEGPRLDSAAVCANDFVRDAHPAALEYGHDLLARNGTSLVDHGERHAIVDVFPSVDADERSGCRVLDCVMQQARDDELDAVCVPFAVDLAAYAYVYRDAGRVGAKLASRSTTDLTEVDA